MGLVPNFGIKVASTDTRRGLCLEVPPHKGHLMRYRTLREKSLTVEGPRLYNSLPMSLRNHCGTYESFKATLDTFLKIVPDKPLGAEYAECINKDGQPSNSLRDWTWLNKLDDWAPRKYSAESHVTAGYYSSMGRDGWDAST